MNCNIEYKKAQEWVKNSEEIDDIIKKNVFAGKASKIQGGFI